MSVEKIVQSHVVEVSGKLTGYDCLANGIGESVAEFVAETSETCSKVGDCTLRAMRSSLESTTGNDRVAVEFTCQTNQSDESLAGCRLAEASAQEIASEVQVFISELTPTE